MGNKLSSQKFISQIGNPSYCVIDSNTVQVFLPLEKESEGLGFTVNVNGKTCSSGKVPNIEDYKVLRSELEKLKNNLRISDLVYQRVKCSLNKSELVKKYRLANNDKIDDSEIMEILNSKCFN